MSLEKSINSGKDWRKQYRDSKRFDASCRPHGGCPWCERNRLHKHRRRQIDDVENDSSDVS